MIALPKGQRTYVNIALLNFLFAASLGLVLRYAFVRELAWLKYKNVMHAHSHVAMLGWIHLLLMVFLWRAFNQDVREQPFTALFWLTEFSVFGMLASFPFQGYGLFSIAFSTLFVILSYIFVYKFWRILSGRSGYDVILIRTGLVWLIVSTLGLWAMGPVMATDAKSSAIYYMAIQFFLHFQFNGWFIFGVLALLFNHLGKLNIPVQRTDFYPFYYLLVVSCLLTFALAVTWADPEDFLFVLNGSGVLIQLAALLFFIRLMNKHLRDRIKKEVDAFPLWFYKLALVSFICKILIQSVVVIPQVAVISYTIRLYVLGFIHLIMLGTITSFLLGYGFSAHLLKYKDGLSRTGWVLFATGLILTEIILFGQGTLLWSGQGYMPHYYIIILCASIFLPLGIFISLLGQLNKRLNVDLKANQL